MPNVVKHNEISFPLLAGWGDATQPMALGQVDGNFRPTFVVSSERARPGESAAAYAARHLSFLKQAMDGYTLVKEGPATFGPNVGFLREHAFNLNGEKLVQLQLYLVVGGGAYVAAFTEKAARLSSSRRAGEEMFEKLQIGVGGPPRSDSFG